MAKGFTSAELIVVIVMLTGLVLITAPAIRLKFDELQLQQTIKAGRDNATIADEYRRRPTITTRNPDNSVTYVYGNVFPGGITASQFNINTGSNLVETSTYGTPFRIVTTSFSTRSVVDIPLTNVSPIGTESRNIPGGTEISIAAAVPADESQNKRIKWKKRVLYLEPAR